MKTALLLIATSENYWSYIDPLLESAKRFFVPHVPVLFTDDPAPHKAYQIYHKAEGFPNATLKRYHTFLKHKDRLLSFDYIFYIDVDALFVSMVGEEVFGDGITATLHHGYAKKRFNCLKDCPETNINSTAYLPNPSNYYCGGFNGGKSAAYLEMAEAIKRNVDIDESKGVLAKWHDESYLNKYLADNPPAKVLSSDYCYPEPELHVPCIPKIVCLDKSLRGGR